MKKTTTKTLLTLVMSLFGYLFAQPTCTLDPTFVASPKHGIWPDSATNFVSGMVGVPYAQNITVKVPLDTVQSPIKICFTRFELLNPTGYTNYNLPPGLTLTGTPASLKFPGNANSCAMISGTPTTAGTYTLHFQVDAYGNTILSMQTCPTPVVSTGGSKITTQNLNYYIINIAPNPTGINEHSVIQSFYVAPNPANNFINLSYKLKDNATNAYFELFDLTGKSILKQSLSNMPGEYSTSIDVSNIESGVYFYTISANKEKYSNKVIISR